MLSNINCPVSFDKVDENITRIIAIVMTAFLVPAILFKSYIIVFLIAVDFSLRAFTDGKYSVIKWVSKNITGLLKLNSKPIDAAPKKFAAGMGMTFSLIILILLYFGEIILAYVFGLMLIGCALLEGIFAVCVGCHIYSWIIVPFYKLPQLKN